MPPTVDVWIAHEGLLDDAALAARLLSLLAPEELERRNRMALETGRRQQLLARALQRELLSRYEPRVAPRDWRFVRGESGRPSLAPPFDASGWHFNLAHTAGLVVMAVGRAAHIGIDVEALDQRVPLQVAQRYFSEREIAALHALEPEEQPRRFLRLWTLKEAYLKALGEGLSGGLDSMCFTFDQDDGVAFECAADLHADRWVFREFTTRGFQLAVAVLDAAAEAPPTISLHEYPAENS
jgi:4'-phosphopantetheinyl transferase